MIHPILPPKAILSVTKYWRGGLLPTFGDSWTLTLSITAAIGLIIYLLS